uniref:Uncharacterized protein n=1 Tax=Anguilla anguilla TaxID=7936 RepID=A0A0E9RZB9_ANGAN
MVSWVFLLCIVKHHVCHSRRVTSPVHLESSQLFAHFSNKCCAF